MLQIKEHYIEYNTLSQYMICYNSSCRTAHKSSYEKSCYSPLCIRHVNVKSKLLSLLRSINVLKREVDGMYLKLYLQFVCIFINSQYQKILIELKRLVDNDPSVKITENTKNTVQNQLVNVKSEEIKRENSKVISQPVQVKEENEKDLKTECNIDQKCVKIENDDEQNIKVDVNGSPG